MIVATIFFSQCALCTRFCCKFFWKIPYKTISCWPNDMKEWISQAC